MIKWQWKRVREDENNKEARKTSRRWFFLSGIKSLPINKYFKLNGLNSPSKDSMAE